MRADQEVLTDTDTLRKMLRTDRAYLHSDIGVESAESSQDVFARIISAVRSLT